MENWRIFDRFRMQKDLISIKHAVRLILGKVEAEAITWVLFCYKTKFEKELDFFQFPNPPLTVV